MTVQDREAFTLMKADVKYTKQSIKEVHTKVDDINDQFKKLSFHLVGDSETETKGWIWKLNRFDGRLSLMEKSIAVGVAVFSGSSIYLVFIKNIFEIF